MKNKIYDVIFFVGGAFIFIISLTAGYNSSSRIYHGSGSSYSGFELWSIIGMAIGVSMIVFGFLRRSWNKKEKEK